MINLVKKHKLLTILSALVLLPLAALACLAKGPHRLYRIDYVKAGDAAWAGPLEVGTAMRDITPDLSLYDTWTDADGNAKFRPGTGDTWQDRNGNGKMDFVWLAGFSNKRPAQGVHDPLWVRAIAFRNNGVTLVMVTIDSIGITYDQFVEVRKQLDPALGIDHVMFSTTHNHEAPDTMGIWSYSPIRPKFDHRYMARVRAACKESIEEAVGNLAFAEMTLAAVELEPDAYVKDTRQPIVHDETLCCARLTETGSGRTIATLLSWGSHPETLGSNNLLITSDFPHYLREGVENGVPEPNGAEGLGGMCLYFQGMVGGLMTPLHLTVPHRDGTTLLEGNTFEKAQALGENLALSAVKALRGDQAVKQDDPRLAVVAKTVFMPMEGLFNYGILLGLVHPGWYWGKGKTEVNAIRIGGLEILTCPGELYPEIAEGGIVCPEGADYPGEPIEVPPLRQEMTGQVNMIIGLANDEIGYIIPKTQWDAEPPYAYSNPENPRKKPQYGEENSPGPDVAKVYHTEALALLNRLHAALE